MGQVVIVEDNEDILKLLAQALKIEGHAVRTCRDGREALQLVPSLGAGTCVILDLMLPKVGGREVLRAIRTRPVRVPVVVLSADPGASGTEADAVIMKPFDLDLVVDTVARLLARPAPAVA